jgi:hypothetical protein
MEYFAMITYLDAELTPKPSLNLTSARLESYRTLIFANNLQVERYDELLILITIRSSTIHFGFQQIEKNELPISRIVQKQSER